MKINKSFGQKIYIEWLDAYTTDGWTTFEAAMKESSNAFCKTNAFYLGQTKLFLVVCHTCGNSKDNSLMGVLNIPLKWIRKIR
ncbi:hypothetical protein LCGC14_0647940 [marine sediment metagenome]|uniref:Uncharacterized protein n=1 Tax=marine sediment metagenome TaxID=412755 RepID=A0A0F9QX83_9ZZZZ